MKKFWNNKRVLITGHTGFKGPWLCLWLNSMGAKVTGLALKPTSHPNLFDLLKINKLVQSNFGDIRDYKTVQRILKKSKAEIIIHMAAQSLVKESYEDPRTTFETNIMGTVNLLEAARHSQTLKACLVVTSDKVYDPKNFKAAFKESALLGGLDPYSSSKSAVELIVEAYRKSFFNESVIATARTGNVIGGGDWSNHRLVPDLVNSIQKKKVAKIRNPKAVRHWIHVLEPLYGYLLLCQKVYSTNKKKYASPWNFGPDLNSAMAVSKIAESFFAAWGQGRWNEEKTKGSLESKILAINSEKSHQSLGWKSHLSIDQTVSWTIEWYKSWINGQDLEKTTLRQISAFLDLL